MRQVYIKTFGCQMNEHDSLKMQLMLETLGYVLTHDPAKANIILYNTCTIREKARHKALSEIGRAHAFKKKNPAVLIGVCGCVAQQDGASLLERYPYVNFIFGPDQISRFPELINKSIAGEKAAALELINNPENYRFLDCTPPVTSHQSPITAFVSVSKGCNCACSFCIVPSVRGSQVSRPADKIVDEVVRLSDIGTKEVTLLGQNVSAYGEKKGALARLIRKISDETNILRIRFTSPHPLWIDRELIKEYAENKKLCPHMHLPVQSGSDAVLKKMRRGYTRGQYIEICTKLREARQAISITTDLIVGFPGESLKDFEDTLELMHEVKFDSAFAFKYSPRAGTVAAEKMQDDVPIKEKEMRLKKLLDLQNKTSRLCNEALLGTRGDVLVTGKDSMRREFLTGRLPDNRIVHFSGNQDLIGDIVPILITKAHDNSLSGEVVK